MNTEMMKLEQLIQATSGLKNRNTTPILAEGKPISEVRISVKDDVPCVNLVTENPVMKRHDARCAFDESHRLPRITEDDFVAHLDDDSFFEEYGNPVVIQSKEHGELVCMSYAYHERMHREIEAAQETVSKASMPTDQEREIDYWIYEFQMPDEDKKKLLDMASSLGMTSDEFIQASFRYAMDHPDESDKEAKLQKIQHANALGIRLVKMYPVYQGETEAQAYRRAVIEGMKREE